METQRPVIQEALERWKTRKDIPPEVSHVLDMAGQEMQRLQQAEQDLLAQVTYLQARSTEQVEAYRQLERKYQSLLNHMLGGRS